MKGIKVKTILIAVTIWVLTITSSADDLHPELTQVTGVEGKAVKLPCGLTPSSGQEFIEWVDLVYNSNPNPQRIFSSANNAQFKIDSTHPNVANYKVDTDYTLTILGLKRADDPGKYECKTVTAEGTTIASKNYYLSIATMPLCTGTTQLKVGDESLLQCAMNFSGTQPTLKWSHNGVPVDSDDHFDVGVAKKRIAFIATHGQDKGKYTCNISIGNMQESCSLTLNVTYLVRDLKIEAGERHKLHVGDDVTCSAKGNPTPDITMEPSDKSGPGWRSFHINKDWLGKNITFHCTASNTHEGVKETLEKNSTFHVLAAEKKPATTTTRAPIAGDQQASGNSEQHHGKHHRKEDSQSRGKEAEVKAVISPNNSAAQLSLERHIFTLTLLSIFCALLC